jgi:hypothetical protein
MLVATVATVATVVTVATVASQFKGETQVRFFENRVLRKIFGSKREKLREDCRKLKRSLGRSGRSGRRGRSGRSGRRGL